MSVNLKQVVRLRVTVKSGLSIACHMILTLQAVPGCVFNTYNNTSCPT